jgi:hypothetical protein
MENDLQLVRDLRADSFSKSLRRSPGDFIRLAAACPRGETGD